MDLAEFRQKAMIAAMQGLLANPAPKIVEMSTQQTAVLAIRCANALVEANMIRRS